MRAEQAGLLLPGDWGRQCARHDCIAGLKEYGITGSVSRQDNWRDKACNQMLLLKSLKLWRLHGQGCTIRPQAKDQVLDWLLCRKRARLHSRPAYVSLMQFEQGWLAHQPRQANS